MLETDRRKIDDLLCAQDFLEDPYPTYERLVAHAPVHRSDVWQCWVVSGYDEVGRALRTDGKDFSTAGRVSAALSSLPSEVRGSLATLERHYEHGLMHSDPPDHTRLRATMNKAFAPRAVARLEERIEIVANELLDTVGQAEEIDAIADYALPLPATVVAEILGIPYSLDRTKLWVESSQEFSVTTPITAGVALRMQESLIEARALIGGAAVQRRREPLDDILTRLVAAHDDGTLTEDELLSTAMTLLLGAYETTAALIGSAVLLLLENRDQLDVVLGNESVMPHAVEEFLRYETPAPRITRVAQVETELGGEVIGKGDSVVLFLAAANRDPSVFADPSVLDVGRTPNRHLAFAVGAHACLGASLARLEAAVALRVLLRRHPRMTLGTGLTPPRWAPNPAMRILRRLPVRLYG